MRVAVYATPFRTLTIAEKVMAFLENRHGKGDEIVVSPATVEALLDYGINLHQIPDINVTANLEDNNGIDFILSLGGDGTFLRAAHWAGSTETPIAGVNLGHLGYLTAFKHNELDQVPDILLSGHYDLESRSMLKVDVDAQIDDDGTLWFTALNEVAILKQDTASMIYIPVRMNSRELGTYNSDGLIISTPTGSTAYNLSVGGPVLQPVVDAIVLSPIADHSLTMRPMVIAGNSTIELTAIGRTTSFRVSLDGNSFVVPTGTKITITAAPFQCKMISRKGRSFASTLRSKLLWGEQPVKGIVS